MKKVSRRTFLAGTAGVALAGLARAAPAAPRRSPFVQRRGAGYVCNGRPWAFFGASIYGTSNPGGIGTIAGTFDLSQQAALNTLRVVNFFDEGDPGHTTDCVNFDVEPRGTDPSVAPYRGSDWARVDAILAEARSRSLKVVLDLSAFRNCLKNWTLANRNVVPQVSPYSPDHYPDWQRLVSFVVHRVNTVNGLRYKRDPTIAYVAFAGEPDPPNSGECLKPTTDELTNFYASVMAYWRSIDPNHMLSSGGLLHIDWEEAFGNPNGSGIDWQAIFSIAQNDVPAIHSYWHNFPPTSSNDYRSPKVSAYCASIAKPWITEEFGFLQQPVDYSTDPPTTYSESDRGAWYQVAYDIQRQYSSSGSLFWNLGTEVDPHSFDVNPNTPATWATVKANAQNV